MPGGVRGGSFSLAGLFAWDGIVLGRWWGRILRYAGEVHVFVIAPSGSKKSTTVSIPTVLGLRPRKAWWGLGRVKESWSVFVHDPKGELHAISAGWRGRCSRVVHVNPTSRTSACHNPLDEVRRDPDHFVRDIEIISSVLGNPDGERPTSDTSRHFMELTSLVIGGTLMHGLETGKAQTLPQARKLMQAPGLWHEMAKMWGSDDDHALITSAGDAMLAMDDKQRSGVLMTIARAFSMTLDPVVARVLSGSDFCMADLRERDTPMALYLTVPFADQERLRPFTRVLANQVLDWNCQELPPSLGRPCQGAPRWRHRLLMLIEEVQSLGYMPAIPRALTYVRGYGMNLMMVTPSMNMIDGVYGRYNNFLEGSHLRLVFAPNDAELAERFAKETGRVRVDGKEGERLLSQTGLTFLRGDLGLLLIGNGVHPALVTKLPYWLHPLWRWRAHAGA